MFKDFLPQIVEEVKRGAVATLLANKESDIELAYAKVDAPIYSLCFTIKSSETEMIFKRTVYIDESLKDYSIDFLAGYCLAALDYGDYDDNDYIE